MSASGCTLLSPLWDGLPAARVLKSWMDKNAQLHKAAVFLSPSQLSGEGNQHARRQRVTPPGHDSSHSNILSEKPCCPSIIHLTLRKHCIEHTLEYLMAQQWADWMEVQDTTLICVAFGYIACKIISEERGWIARTWQTQTRVTVTTTLLDLRASSAPDMHTGNALTL